MEPKASLPPIIEDESDDSLMPLLYRKELSKRQQRDNGSVTEQADEHANSRLSSSNNSCIINATQMPYNSWKSKFCFKKSDPIESSDMQSKLGQSLESCHILPTSQINPTSQASDHFYPPNQTPADMRQTDLTNRGGFKASNYGEQEKCVPQQFQDTKSFNFSYNETPKGYFPEHNRKPFREYASHGENSYRTFPTDYVTDQYKYITPERSYNQINSYSAFGKPNHNSFSPQQVSPSTFHHTNYNGSSHTPPNYQNGCCNNGQIIPPNMNNFCPPHRNPEYGHSTKQIIKPITEASSCNCHMKSEIRDKKIEKLDKVRKKQISDLYRIVWLQNEQIIQVQNQLKKLIQVINERSDEKPKRSHDTEHTPKVTHKGTSEKRMFNLSVIEENQNLMEKVSVGIMTSFIDTTKVTKKGQQTNVKNKRRTQKSSSSSTSSNENSSCSSSEEEADLECVKKLSQKKKKSGAPYEDSIILNGIEIPTAADNNSPTSSPPMQIELNDYDSTSNSTKSDETSEESEDDSPVPPVGWTFYDKVVGKVNNMLNKSESESNSDTENQRKTVEHIRKLGMNLEQESPSSKRVTFNSPYHQKALLPDSDTSLKMNALAVKYYKEDKSSQEDESYKVGDRHQNNVVNNTNLSYATLRYLERYHLPKLAQSTDKVEKEKKSKKKKEKIKKEEKYEDKKSHKRKSKSGQHAGKILDITAIKQQPKLLPKKQ